MPSVSAVRWIIRGIWRDFGIFWDTFANAYTERPLDEVQQAPRVLAKQMRASGMNAFGKELFKVFTEQN